LRFIQECYQRYEPEKFIGQSKAMKRVSTNPKSTGGSHTVYSGEVAISFELSFASRKTLAIRIHPDGRIAVAAPTGTRLVVIEGFVTSRAGWIMKHLAAIKQRPTTPIPEARRYVSGEQYHYLGTAYPLLVEADPITRVVLLPDKLRLGIRDPADTKRVQMLLVRWYRLHAERVFAERLGVCLQQVAPLGITTAPPLAIRQMKTRWGSCTSRGKITLNLKLIQAPVELIDYVILHELCHLKEMNHSPRFWALVTHVCPDWRQRRKILNQSRWEGVPTA
jgi:hypothetical protein